MLTSYASAATIPGGIAGFNTAFITGPADTGIYVYPATSGSKPSGVGPASYTDWTAIGILVGVTDNRQYETLDTNTGTPIFITTSTGRPGTSTTPISTVGGPLVHSCVYWLEFGGTGSISPVHYSAYNPGGVWYQYFLKRSDNSILAQQATSTPVTSQDYFVIYTVQDSSGNIYYVFYGLRWTGSLAASHLLLYWKQNGLLGSQTTEWQVWKWEDNGNGLVQSPGVDTYTKLFEG